MADTFSFKCLILRAVLRQVSPMVIRLISVSDQLQLADFHDIFPRDSRLGWQPGLHHPHPRPGVQQFSSKDAIQSSARTQTASTGKFLYICDTLHMWEWDIRVIDIQEAVEGDDLPVCAAGRSAAPPEFCGGPTGYRLMIKGQRESAAMSDPNSTAVSPSDKATSPGASSLSSPGNLCCGGGADRMRRVDTSAND